MTANNRKRKAALEQDASEEVKKYVPFKWRR